MNFFKFILVISLLGLSFSSIADETDCPEGETLVPYHNTCMVVPTTPACPEGETWIPYHKTCAVLPVKSDEESEN